LNRRACHGDSGAVMLRTNRSGDRSSRPGSSHSMVMAAGGNTVERMPNRATSSANDRGWNRSITTTGAPTRSANSTL
jgi:hypothetical protein